MSDATDNNKKIVIIDDDRLIRKLLTVGLSLRGYECLVAENGEAAQSVILSNPVDVIMVDLMMPFMDGLSFLHWLRGTANVKVPVLVLTSAATNEEVQHQVMDAGASGIAHKPIDIESIAQELRRIQNE